MITARRARPDGPEATDRSHVIEDGGYSAAFAMIAQTLSMPRLAWAAQKVELKILREYLRRGRLDEPGHEIRQILGATATDGASLPLLGMGNEPPQGRMRLDDRGKLQVDWSFPSARPYFKRVRATMQAIAAELGGRAASNILWRLNAVVTVHPVGGCPMGATAADGVVDPGTGEVHGHPGLHVADGSVMPGLGGGQPEPDDRGRREPFASGILAA